MYQLIISVDGGKDVIEEQEQEEKLLIWIWKIVCWNG
jgi:hypothetical protein